MLDGQADSSLEVPLLTTESVNGVSTASPLEEEVAALFDQLRNPLLRYILSLGLPPHDAEEVIQEVFLCLFQHLLLGKSRRNLRGWVFRVGHNLALKQRYSHRSHVMTQSEETWLQHVDPEPNPEEALADRQRQDRLLAVVRALPEQDRCCLHLRAEGLRYREIAEVVGMSLGAVSLSLVRSLARLTRADRG
jgi:RNA polymerase sigma-70 factor (ECF subfamily)